MPKLLFVDTDLDWSNFSVAGHIRALHPGTTVEMIHTCDLTALPVNDDLFLSAHGSSRSSGEFKSTRKMARTLKEHHLNMNHQSLIFLTCSASAAPPQEHLNSFAFDLKQDLRVLGYADLNIVGGRGAVVVFPTGKTAIKSSHVPQAINDQATVATTHQAAINHCILLVTLALANPTPHVLEDTADQVAIALVGFYADLAVAFAPHLKKPARAFQTHPAAAKGK